MSTQNSCQHFRFPIPMLALNNFHPYSPEPTQNQSLIPIEPNINLQYFEEYKKLYFTAYCISLQLRKIAKTHEELTVQVNRLERKMQEEVRNQFSQQNLDKDKRLRRKAEQIQRRFFCQAARCGRSYGTEGSLQQHIKLKHPELFKQNQASGQQSL